MSNQRFKDLRAYSNPTQYISRPNTSLGKATKKLANTCEARILIYDLPQGNRENQNEPPHFQRHRKPEMTYGMGHSKA